MGKAVRERESVRARFSIFLHKKNLKHRASNLPLVIASEGQKQEMKQELSDYRANNAGWL